MSHDHHHEEETTGFDRRSFLKLAGFSFGAILAGCQEGKLEKAIPFLIQPEEVTPGLAYWYSTTCHGCSAACGVLAKNRDGRPVKLEGNPDHPLSRGGLCAIGQASLLTVYDSQRLRAPHAGGKQITWEELDAAVMDALARHAPSGIRILTGTINSPATLAVINRFLARYGNARHIQYDAISTSAILDAHALSHGVRVLPHYRFDKAKTIVSFAADFLGSWISAVEFTAAYRKGRSLEGTPPKFSRHIHIESALSLTGSNADKRIAVSPGEMQASVKLLMMNLLKKSGTPASVAAPNLAFADQIEEIAGELWNARGESLVVCGANDTHTQLMVNVINQLLGNYGSTLDVERPSLQAKGNDAELNSLLDEIESGQVGILITAGCNPVYDLPVGTSLGEKLATLPLTIALSDRLDETASAARFALPLPHPLEGWNDAEPVAGVVAVTQPVMQSLSNGRSLAESLARWMGEKKTAYELIREEWNATIFKRATGATTFEKFWNDAVMTGVAQANPPPVKASFKQSVIADTLNEPASTETGSMMLVLQPSLTMLDGRHAHNPWLHELPDPVTKIVWDNYASLSQRAALRLGVVKGDIVTITTDDGKRIALPVHIQPGQHEGVVAVAFGYGRKGTDRFFDIGPKWMQSRPTVEKGHLVGVNAAPLLAFVNGSLQYAGRNVTLAPTSRSVELVATQEYDSLYNPDLLGKPTTERRPIVQETTLAAYTKDPSAGSFDKHEIVSMWSDDHKYTGHHWGMAIDLTACTGCSACVVSCQAENNIPVVGKDEVRRNREMTWIRIDRYYDESDGNFSVAHQPMMCQHCGNAPCETVCPVLATVHNDEGLNQQIYNRCVGTRYCANNCPYKIRRFNWFHYYRGDDMQRMVLNPDVTVRDRGVMEKCSFCVQRIQLAKIEAKRDGRPVKDGDVQPACAQSCPAKAIMFGDMNDPKSTIAAQMKDPRYYRVLEEIGVKPSVGYMTLVHDREETKEVTHG
ncbi:MAG: 4Fe-4S dicluster domain-containing protein [Bacteroidetes bacterium]|nr:4Fe-4S dicluster domain-containing protein [Bacteroidota bacterium]MCW5896743.1 4Fe-4S dicluster domain-containing protein [Bacteroidota bacterium]